MIIKEDYFQYITEGVKPINDGKNRIYYGEVNEFFSTEVFRNFSIKLALQGTIHYKTQQQEYRLSSNNFLLSNRQPGTVVVDSASLVRGIFIDIQQETIDEACNVITAGDDCDFDNLQAGYFFSPAFFENTYTLKNKALDKALKQLVYDLTTNTLRPGEETFLSLAEKVVEQETGNYKSLANLKSVRSSTKQELLKRLLQGKDYIDDNFLKTPGIAEIVKHCNMSSFHFFRSFKQAFGCSPYQYIINKRLEHAKILIRTGESFTSIALQCGFADLFSFSKAFKKLYGASPSDYKAKKLQLAVTR
ncbi:helix-turn-helix domain-containing protein [Ferruginibacter profundus]